MPIVRHAEPDAFLATSAPLLARNAAATFPGVAPRSLGGRSMALADLSYERRFSLKHPLGLGSFSTVAPFE